MSDGKKVKIVNPPAPPEGGRLRLARVKARKPNSVTHKAVFGGLNKSKQYPEDKE
jgi:hypothetical protein